MPVDIRATVSCSLGTVISGNVNDEYVQGTGLIKYSGTVVISGLITPAIGTAVTFTYTKSGVTRSIPRKLRVLSSFADPFRRTTSVELGCKLTYLSDKRDSIDWTAFDDDENTLTEEDAKIITIPIRAQAVAKKCMDELGITGSFTLTNKFSVAKFDLSAGYVQVLSDLLVSESLCGYLDANETLQVFSLDQAGGTGPVLDATQLVDIGKIGVGQLPGEAVTVSYSSLKLKREVSQTNPEDIIDDVSPGNNESGFDPNLPWYNQRTTNIFSVYIDYKSPTTAQPAFKVANILEVTTISTKYTEITTADGQAATVPVERITVLETRSPAVIGSLYTEYLSNGIEVVDVPVTKQTFETFAYDQNGIEVFYTRSVIGGFGFLIGSVSIPFVFSKSDYVAFAPNRTVSIEYETRSTIVTEVSRQVTTTTYTPWYKTQNGQQAVAAMRPALNSAFYVNRYLDRLAASPLVLADARVEIISGSTGPVSAPSRSQIIIARNARGGNARFNYRTESKADLQLALGSATAQRRIELSLPYAPDDSFIKTGSVYSSIESDAAQKAQKYGICQNRLLLGNRNGMNIQCAPEILPGAPFAPFVVRSGSTSALYRTNGTNWTFDAQGLVVSTDALFWGGVGGNAVQSWFPIAPGITTLPTSPGTTTVNITDASGNVVGSYEQMVVGNVVPAYQETRLVQGTLRVRPVVTLLPYALQDTATVAIATKLQAVVRRLLQISVPVADMTIAGYAPTVSTGARVLVPAAVTQVAALAPGVSTGATVRVPAAGLALAGLDLEYAGRQKTVVNVPVADIAVAGLVPLVASGASVAVPAANVTVAGVVPSVVTVPVDPNYSNVTMLLHLNGTNNSTTFTDSTSTPLTPSVFGATKISTTQSKSGGASAYFDGNGDYLRYTFNSDFDLLGGDFTVECWVYPEQFKDGMRIAACSGGSAFFNSTNGVHWRMTFTTAGALRLEVRNSSGNGTVTSTATATANTWTHVAVCVSGSTGYVGVGGTVLSGSLGTIQRPSTDPVLTIATVNDGGGGSSTTAFQGYIDEFRITKTVARYTANYTVPTAAFPDQ